MSLVSAADTTSLSLAVAFGALAPLTGGTDDVRRQQAAAVIYTELHRLSSRSGPQGDADDAASMVFCRLLTSGPREHDTERPSSDEAVRRYLLRALRNAMIDGFRKAQRGESLGAGTGARTRGEAGERGRVADVEVADVEVADTEPSPEAALLAKEAAAERRSAEREFFGAIVPALATRIRQVSFRDDFVALVALLWRAEDDELPAAGLTSAMGLDPSDRTAANRFYQRVHRARERLMRWAHDELPAYETTPERREYLRHCVTRLGAR